MLNKIMGMAILLSVALINANGNDYETFIRKKFCEQIEERFSQHSCFHRQSLGDGALAHLDGISRAIEFSYKYCSDTATENGKAQCEQAVIDVVMEILHKKQEAMQKIEKFNALPWWRKIFEKYQ